MAGFTINWVRYCDDDLLQNLMTRSGRSMGSLIKILGEELEFVRISTDVAGFMINFQLWRDAK